VQLKHSQRPATSDAVTESAEEVSVAVQRVLGVRRLEALRAGAGADEQELYLLHLAQLQAETGLDFSGYLPWSAPPSFLRSVAPWYRVLANERGQARPEPTELAEDEEPIEQALALLPAPARELERPAPTRAHLAGLSPATSDGEDPWGLRGTLQPRDTPSLLLLEALRTELPDRAEAPPLALVHAGLSQLLQHDGDTVAGLAGVVRAEPPSASSLEALQADWAPYPTFAAAAALQVEAMGVVDCGQVEASVSRHAEADAERWDPALVLSRITESRGHGLEPGLAARMAQALGRELPAVVIHTDEAAAQAAEALNARAFAQGHHLYFARGEWAPGTREGDELLAHELTHVVQHAEGRLPQGSGEGLDVSSPSDSHEREAYAAGREAASRLDDTAGQPLWGAAFPPEQRLAAAAMTWGLSTGLGALGVVAEQASHEVEPGQDGDVEAWSLSGAWDAVSGVASDAWDMAGAAVDAVGDAAGAVMELGADALLGMVRMVSPGLADLIADGPGGMIQELMESTVGSWVTGLLPDIDLGGLFSQIGGTVTEVLGTLGGALGGDLGCCTIVGDWINALSGVVGGILNHPAIESAKGVLEGIQSTMIDIYAMILAPGVDVLKTILGAAWDGVTAVVNTVRGWFSAASNAAGVVWDWVKDTLGFGGDSSEGGVWNWIKGFADDVWTSLKETFAPVAGPLQTIGTVLAALTPMGQMYIAFQVGGELIRCGEWLWQNWGRDDMISAAHQEMGGTILPGFLDAINSFSTGFGDFAGWIGGQLTSFAGSLLGLLEAVSGIPLVGLASGFIQSVSNAVSGAIDWAVGGLRDVWSSITKLARDFWTWAQPIVEVLTSLALCAVNPAMIPVVLTGWAWRLLPDCLKGPIIDFILTVVIGLLEAMPDLLIFGPLWLMLKPGVLGFLRGMLGMDTEVKVEVSNKFARILSGSSLAFIWGFCKGFIKGIWEGITDPFVMAWMLFKGVVKLGDWAGDLARETLTGEAGASEGPGIGQEASTFGRHMAGRAVGRAGAGALGEELGEGGARVASRTGVRVGRATAGAVTGNAEAPTADATPSRNNQIASELREKASSGWDTISGLASELSASFWPAVQEWWNGSEGMSFDQLIAKLGDLWPQVQAMMQEMGGNMATRLCAFLMQDSAEEDMGSAIGWLAGTIVFEIVLFYFTAGAGNALLEGSRWSMKFLRGFVQFLDWTGAAMGAMFKGLAKVGGWIVDIGKSLGRALGSAGGAMRGLLGTIGELGEAIVKWADELFGIADGAVDDVAAAGARETSQAATEVAARETTQAATDVAARETTQAAGGVASRETAEGATEVGARQAPEAAGREAAGDAGEVAAREAGEGTVDVATREAIEAAGERGARATPQLDQVPLAQQVDEVTGVAKGADYDQAMSDMRDFYRRQAQEAEASTRQVAGVGQDGPYGWRYGYDVTEVNGVTHVNIKVHLDGAANGIPAEDLARVRANTTAGVDAHYNWQHQISNAQGGSNRLHVEVEFVDAPGAAHLKVEVHPGDGGANLSNWYVDGHSTTHAHELGHQMGLLDEYVDAAVPNRATAGAPGTSNDGSLMGNYWTRDAAGNTVPGADTGLRGRHLQQIGDDIAGSRPVTNAATDATSAGVSRATGEAAETGAGRATGEAVEEAGETGAARATTDAAGGTAPRAPGQSVQGIDELSDALGGDLGKAARRFEELNGLPAHLRNADGTLNVDAARTFFEKPGPARFADDSYYDNIIAGRTARANQSTDSAISRINNTLHETSAAGRTGATIGDGSSEAALRHEASTGLPVGGRGHSVKIDDSVRALESGIADLQRARGRITEPARLAEIDDAIARANARLSGMRQAQTDWANRVTDRPDIWNPDGTSKVQPDWPPATHR